MLGDRPREGGVVENVVVGTRARDMPPLADVSKFHVAFLHEHAARNRLVVDLAQAGVPHAVDCEQAHIGPSAAEHGQCVGCKGRRAIKIGRNDHFQEFLSINDAPRCRAVDGPVHRENAAVRREWIAFIRAIKCSRQGVGDGRAARIGVLDNDRAGALGKDLE